MQDSDFDIALWGSVPGAERLIADFEPELRELGGRVRLGRERSSVYGGSEWALPTAFVLFIAAQYFGGMLQELGRDHYTKLRDILTRLLARANREPISRVEAREGKLSKEPPGALSVWLVVEEGVVFKHVFDRHAELAEAKRAVEALLINLEMLCGSSDEEVRKAAGCFGWRVAFRYERERNEWAPFDTVSETFLRRESAAQERPMQDDCSTRGGYGG